MFTPVKIGIAGERYFEVLVGLKAGDQVITGPFSRSASCSTATPSAPTAAVNDGRRGRQAVTQILRIDQARAAAIWANKLRSLMTVLGNIVAVTSIVTVVSLIQGMNAMVTDAIVSGLGADSFTIQRLPACARTRTTSERIRNNPLITHGRGGRRSALQPAHRRGDGAGRSSRHGVAYREQVLESVQIQGVTARLPRFLDLQRRARPHDERDRGRRATGRWRCSAGEVADRLFGAVDPLDKTIKIAGVPFRVVGVSDKKGVVFGNSLDEFAVIPLGAYQKMFGARQSLQLLVKPRDPGAGASWRWTTRRWRCASSAG